MYEAESGKPERMWHDRTSGAPRAVLVDGPGCTPAAVPDQPRRAPSDPKCTIWATFADLRIGDHIDYWGTARPVIEHQQFDDGRVRLQVTNAYAGCDVALAPGDEGTWRTPRDEEL